MTILLNTSTYHINLLNMLTLKNSQVLSTSKSYCLWQFTNYSKLRTLSTLPKDPTSKLLKLVRLSFDSRYGAKASSLKIDRYGSSSPPLATYPSRAPEGGGRSYDPPLVGRSTTIKILTGTAKAFEPISRVGAPAPVRLFEPVRLCNRCDLRSKNSLINKFTNLLMTKGKKTKALKLIINTLEELSKLNKVKNINLKPIQENLNGMVQKHPEHLQRLNILVQAINKVKPRFYLRKVRVAGVNYQVPSILPPKRQLSMAIRWIIEGAKIKQKKTPSLPFFIHLAQEIHDSFGTIRGAKAGTVLKLVPTGRLTAGVNPGTALLAGTILGGKPGTIQGAHFFAGTGEPQKGDSISSVGIGNFKNRESSLDESSLEGYALKKRYALVRKVAANRGSARYRWW